MVSKKDASGQSMGDVEKMKEAVAGSESEDELDFDESEEVEEEKTSKNSGSAKGKEKKEPQLTDLPGIGNAVAAKLESAGIYDLMSLAVMTPSDLAELAGVGAAVARKAIQASRDLLDLGFQDGSEYAKKREDVSYITTGSKELDNLLGGKGISTRSITEAFGAYGSGKTQIGLTLSVNTQLPIEKGGASGKCVFIDTEGTFRPPRVRQIAEGIGANPEKVLKNILVARAFNSDHQILLLERIGEMIKNGEKIKLLIVDSLTAHFRAEFSGRGQLAERQQKLNRYMHDLMRLAETYNIAVYVTNQVMANPAQLFGDPTTAIGGNIVGHASTYRMYLRRGKKDSRVAKLIDSPDLPDSECLYYVTSSGIRDEQ